MYKLLFASFVIFMRQSNYCLSQEFCRAGDGECNQSEYKGIRENERRILLIGKTGVGKSSVGNSILGENVFHAETSGESVTKKMQLGQTERFGKKLVVVDTPGLFDTNMDNDKVMMELAKCFVITSPGLHAIVLVVEIGRFKDEDRKTVEYYLDRFGENVIDFVVIAFTHKDKLEKECKTIHDFIGTLRPDSALKKLLNRIDSRFTAFGYNGDKYERDNEVKDLLGIIDSIMDKSGGKFYTNEMYKETEQRIHARIANEEREAKEKLEKENQEIRDGIKKDFENQYAIKEYEYKEEIRKLEETRDNLRYQAQYDEFIRELITFALFSQLKMQWKQYDISGPQTDVEIVYYY